MPSEPQRKIHTAAERRRVLEASRLGGDFLTVARHNEIPLTTARRIVRLGRADLMQQGGARASLQKCTPEIVDAIVAYVEEDCTYTIAQMKGMVLFDFQVGLSITTISKKLRDQLYTVKQVRVVPATCNNAINKEKRHVFAMTLLKYIEDGGLIVYYDETSFNLYCKRAQGRAISGKRATVVLPSSKGPSLQVQRGVSTEIGVVHHELHRESIKMDVNPEFVERVYRKAKESPVYDQEFAGKKITIMLDNAPAHSQTEERVDAREDLVLLRLGLYSPMCNPIKRVQGSIKAFLALRRDEMLDIGPFTTLIARRMDLLERAASSCIEFIDSPRLISRMASHCRHAVAAAIRREDMQYGA